MKVIENYIEDTRNLEDATIKEMQDGLLRETLAYVSERSPYYRERLRGIVGRCGVDDIGLLPVTRRDELQEDNWGLLCVDRKNIAEVVATTGTTGNPLFIALTAGDMERLAENERRWFSVMGLGAESLVQIAVTMDNLFVAGMAYYKGLEALGAGIIRSGASNAKRQLELIVRLKPDVIIAVPSFMLKLSREAEKLGLKPGSLKKALLIGETIRGADMVSNQLGRLVEEAWNIECFSTYGITEASVAFTECASHAGFHSHPDLVFTEVLDDEGMAVPDGDIGELVVTTFKVEAMPLIRYATGDVCFKLEGPCDCGSAMPRIGPVIGRKAQKLKVKGTTVYPGAIENALLKVAGVVNCHITAYSGEAGTDLVRVVVGVDGDVSSPGVQAILQDARSSLKASARFTPVLEVLTPQEVERLLCSAGGRKNSVFKDIRERVKSL